MRSPGAMTSIDCWSLFDDLIAQRAFAGEIFDHASVADTSLDVHSTGAEFALGSQ